MKFFLVSVFLCVFLVFVQSFPLEDNAEFEVHENEVEIPGTGDELMSLVRNKIEYNFPPPQRMGGNTALGSRLHYDIPQVGDSVMAIHDFVPLGGTKAGVEGRLNLDQIKNQIWVYTWTKNA